jgi:nucleotide-binding universal stress UspA family protein
VLGTAFGSNLFNLLFGLGLPALISPLVIGETAILSFIFMNLVNASLLVLLLSGFRWLGGAKYFNRVSGVFLAVTYVGFIVYQMVSATGGALVDWLKITALIALVSVVLSVSWRWVSTLVGVRAAVRVGDASRERILCATRGGRASQPMHEKAIELAKDRNAELVFLYVFDQSALQRVVTPIVINAEAQVNQMLAYLQATAQEQARQAGVPAQVLVRIGILRDEIKAAVDTEQVTLIVLGSPMEDSSVFQLQGLRKFADEIEQETDTPVLISSECRPEQIER